MKYKWLWRSIDPIISLPCIVLLAWFGYQAAGEQGAIIAMIAALVLYLWSYIDGWVRGYARGWDDDRYGGA